MMQPVLVLSSLHPQWYAKSLRTLSSSCNTQKRVELEYNFVPRLFIWSQLMPMSGWRNDLQQGNTAARDFPRSLLFKVIGRPHRSVAEISYKAGIEILESWKHIPFCKSNYLKKDLRDHSMCCSSITIRFLDSKQNQDRYLRTKDRGAGEQIV